MQADHDAQGRRVRLQVWYPEMPPTSNNIYFKGSHLTEPAREYRERFKMYVAQNYLHLFGEMEEPNERGLVQVKSRKKGEAPQTAEGDVRTRNPNLVYKLDLFFYMDWLTSWGDPATPPSRRAEFRYKKVDLTNRIKFLEDCFKYSLGIDDSLTFAASQMKVQSPQQEGVMIIYTVMPPEMFGIPSIPTTQAA